jgi:hypothetical protein
MSEDPKKDEENTGELQDIPASTPLEGTILLAKFCTKLSLYISYCVEYFISSCDIHSR